MPKLSASSICEIEREKLKRNFREVNDDIFQCLFARSLLFVQLSVRSKGLYIHLSVRLLARLQIFFDNEYKSNSKISTLERSFLKLTN